MRQALLLRRTLVVLSLGATLVVGCGGNPAPDPVGPRARVTDIHLERETTLIRDVVPRHGTLEALLREHGVETTSVAAALDALKGVFDPRQLRSLQPFVLERSMPGALRLFEYEIDSDSFLRVASRTPTSPDVTAEVLPIPKTIEHVVAAGVIDEDASSLFAAMKQTGEGDELAIALAQIFSGEVDFNSEIQLGDRFVVVFERVHREGRASLYGDVLAAEMVRGQPLRAFQFAPPGGEPAYYDEHGRSTRRLFLKSPLEFDPRITSGFSMNRRHPVLHTSRAHRGVDYRAPTGAPVVAVASGTVVSATHDSANGRMVRIRHASGYQSYYLHLSRFAPGMRAGVRVTQGQRIGFVGSTGLSTGPHLHYGLTKNGTFVNPVTEHRKMPPGEPIAPEAMAAFRELRDQRLVAMKTAAADAE